MAKKITVKYYLNKNRRETFEFTEQSNNKIIREGLVYSTYVQVIYNQNNTKFKSMINDQIPIEHETIDQLNTTYIHLKRTDENYIRKIMNYEISKYGEDYDLKGFNDKYRLYITSIHDLLGRFLIKELRRYVMVHCPLIFSALNFKIYDRGAFVIFTILNKMYPTFDQHMNEELKLQIAISKEYYELTKTFLNKTWLSEKQLETGDLFKTIGYYEGFKDWNFPVLVDWVNGTHMQEVRQMMKEKAESDEHTNEMIAVIDKILISYEK
ncbi:MAG: hypothetical protein NTW49_08185 [Bacteroidia bacterium]|nr:hypothetical protein [Bacteroidia bacterium]